MAENQLVGEARDGTGKGVARKLRAAGRIPAVLYGKGREPSSLTVDPKELRTVLHKSGAGMNTLIDLQLGGASQTVLVKHLQREPLRGGYLHADFFEVDLSQKIEVSVPVHFLGKAKGIDLGGIVDHTLRELEIECLPGAIPESIDVDVTELDIGDSIHVSEIALPEGVEVKTDGALAVASVVAPTVEEEAEAEVEEGAEAEAAGGEAAAAAPAEGDKGSEG